MSALLPAPPSPIAVVGAGFLGQRVVRQLARAPGVELRATTRDGQWRDGDTPPGVTMRALDVINDDDASVRAALAGARALVILFAAGRQQPRAAIYLEGTRRLLAACPEGLERVVYTSSTSALPDRDGWVDDDCETWPTSERGRVQRGGEQLVRERCGARGIPWAVLRLGGLYGPGRGIGRIYRNRGAAHDAPPRPGDGMEATNLIHVADATRCALAALRLDPSRSGVINVCADAHPARRDMYQQAAAMAGVAPPRWAEEPTPGRGVHGKRVRNTRMKRWLEIELEHAQHSLE